MIPLPLFWVVSTSVPYLLCVQVVAGVSWAAFELAIILMSFDCIPASHRTSMLTVYNLGYAVASVAGSAVGGLLLTLGGETYTAYLVVFAVSAAGRVLTLPLLGALPHKIREDDRSRRHRRRTYSISASPSPCKAPATSPPRNPPLRPRMSGSRTRQSSPAPEFLRIPLRTTVWVTSNSSASPRRFLARLPCLIASLSLSPTASSS